MLLETRRSRRPPSVYRSSVFFFVSVSRSSFSGGGRIHLGQAVVMQHGPGGRRRYKPSVSTVACPYCDAAWLVVKGPDCEISSCQGTLRELQVAVSVSRGLSTTDMGATEKWERRGAIPHPREGGRRKQISQSKCQQWQRPRTSDTARHPQRTK